MSDQELGLLISVYALGGLTVQPIIGYYSDMFGRKYLMVFGLFLTGIATTVYAFIDKFWMLLIARLPRAAIPSITDIFPSDKHGTALSIVNAANYVGTLLEPPTGGIMFDDTLQIFLFWSGPAQNKL